MVDDVRAGMIDISLVDDDGGDDDDVDDGGGDRIRASITTGSSPARSPWRARACVGGVSDATKNKSSELLA